MLQCDIYSRRASMKAIKNILIIFAILASFFSCAYANISSDIKVKQLYSEPANNSKIVYEIPMDVKLTDVSEDGNWYKVAIKFNFGPAEFKYTGWAYIPVANILAERTLEKSKVAAILE